jgi:hypothetical protein
MPKYKIEFAVDMPDEDESDHTHAISNMIEATFPEAYEIETGPVDDDITPEHPISDAAYVASSNSCMACGSKAIESDHLDADGTVAVAKCKCLRCGATWLDHWTLTGYGEFKLGKKT